MLLILLSYKNLWYMCCACVKRKEETQAFQCNGYYRQNEGIHAVVYIFRTHSKTPICIRTLASKLGRGL